MTISGVINSDLVYVDYMAISGVIKETSGSRNKKNTVFRSCHFQMHWYLIQLCARAYFNISRMNTNKNIIYNMPLVLQEAKSTVVAIFKCPGMTKKNVRVQRHAA